MILDTTVCNDITVLTVLSLIKRMVNLITIIVPVILVIFVIIEIIKTVASGDVDTKKLFKAIKNRLFAAFIIFLVPVLVNFVLQLIPNNKLYYVDCYNNANASTILEISLSNADTAMSTLKTSLRNFSANKDTINYQLAQRDYELARKAVKEITDKNKRSEYEKDLATYKTLMDAYAENL